MKNDLRNFGEFIAKPLNEDVNIDNESVKKPKSLPKEILNELDECLADEYHAYYFYVNAHNWCLDKNYNNAAAFFKGEFENELIHARTMMDYMIDWNYKSSVKKVETDYDFKSLVEIIEKAYDIEYELLNKYNKTSATILTSGDIATFDFLCYFRNVQLGEVKEYSDFLNALQLIDTNNKFEILYFEKEYFN